MATPQGPSASDLSSQAAAAEKLTAAMAALTATLDKLAPSTSNQARASSEVTDAMGDLESAMAGANRENEEFRKGLQAQIDSMESFSDAAAVMKNVLKRMGSDGKSAAAAMAGLGGALKGMASGFKLSFNLAKSFIGGVQSIIGAVFDLTAAILSVPFKLWESLIGMAKGGGGGGGGLLEAVNKVREDFGDIKKGTAAEVIDIARGLASWGDMAPGLMKVSRQFGTLKDAIEYVMKLAGPAPVLFSSLKDQFEKTGKNVFIMAKGLGIGEEEFSGLMNAAKSTGETVENIEVEMTKFAKGLSAEFGLNSKLMSRDMSRAMKDVKHFANSSVKEIAKATAYAHSLGLELKDITGILDAFNTFDQAAENVSKLSQAFGVNIDVMKLVEAKTPDDALKMLKDSFTSAGKSVENMNRQELQLIASTVGMSEEAVRQGLSSKNQAISMNRLAATTDNLAKKTMTASEATAALKNDIEHVIQGGGGGGPESNSLMGMFFEGFKEGITTTSSFREIIRNLRMDFVVVMEQGRQLGRAFVEYFPGVKKFFEGLADILSPDKIGGLFKSYKETFIKFFKDMAEGKGTVRDLMEALQKNFTDYLTKSGPGGHKVLQGLQEFWKAFKLVIASALEYLGDMLRDGLETIVDVISGKYNEKIGSVMGKVGKEVSPIATAFGNLFEKVKGPLGILFDKFMSWAAEKLANVFKEHWGKIMLYVMGPAVVSGLGRGLMSYVSTRLVQGPIAGQLQKMTGILQERLPQMQAGGEAATQAGAALDQTSKGLGGPAQTFGQTFKQGFASSIGPAMANVAEFAAKAGIAFYAMKSILDYVKENTFSPRQIEMAKVLIDAMMDFFVKSQLVSGLQGLAGRLGGGAGVSTSQLLVGLASMGLVVGAMMYTATSIVKDAKGIDNPDKLKAAAEVVTAVGNMFLKAIPVIAAAVLVGMGLMAGGGIGSLITGGGILAGMAAISGVVATMVLIAQDVMKKAAAIPGSASEIKDKSIAIAAVIEAVASLTKSVSEVLKSLPMNMFSGKDKIRDTFDAASGFMNALLGTSGGVAGAVRGDSGIAGIISKLQALASLPAVNVEAAAKIAPVISAIADTISAISQALAAMKNKVSIKGSVLWGAQEGELGLENFGDNLTAMAPIIQKLMGGANKIIKTITSSFAGKDARQAEALGKMGEGMGSIMSGVASALSALTAPVQHFRKKSNEIIKHHIGPDDTRVVEEFDAKAFQGFAEKLSEIAPAIGASMSTLMGSVTSSAINAAKDITPEKMQGVKAVIDIIGAAGQLIGFLTTGAQGVKVDIEPAIENKQVNIKNSEEAVKNTYDFSGMMNQVILPDISNVIKTLANPETGISAMIERVMGVIKANPLNTSDIATAKAMSEIFKVISDLMKALNEMMPVMYASLGHVAGVTEEGEKQAGRTKYSITSPETMTANLKKSFDVMALLLEGLTQGGDGINSTLVRIANAAEDLPLLKKGTIEKVAGLKDLMGNLKDMKRAMDDAFAEMTTIGERESLGSQALASQRAVGGTQSVMPNQMEQLEASIDAGGGGQTTATADQVTMAQKFKTMAEKLESITGGAAGGKDSPIGKLTAAISSFNTMLPAEKIAAIGTAQKNLKDFNANTAGFNAELTTLSENTIINVGETVKKNVEALATALQQFNAGLPSGIAADAAAINVKLGSIANGLGVKDASYAIARGPINFEFKITVEVDGSKLEAAVVDRPGSYIVGAFGAVQSGKGLIQGVAPGLKNVAQAAESPSDIRLKEQIEWVDKSPLGINIYEFKYIGQEGRYRGVMAQELLGTPYENAVTFNGQHYSVLYDKIDVDFIKVD